MAPWLALKRPKSSAFVFIERVTVTVFRVKTGTPTLVQALRFLCLVWLTGSIAAAQTRAGVPERGEAFATANCAQCHAVGRTGTSPLAAAPVLRDIHRRYPVSQLAEALAEGITSGHSTMPEFQLNQPQIADLLAYLTTLEH